MSQVITTFDKVGMTANGAALPVTQRIDYASGNTGVSQDLADGNGNRGILDRRANRMRVVRCMIQPSLDFEPTPAEWAMLLPWLLGGTNATVGGVTTYTAGDDLPARVVQLREDRDGSEFTHTLSGVLVDGFSIRASSADPLVTCSTQLLGSGYDPNGTIFPDTLEQDNDLDNTGSPFVFADTTAAGTPAGAMTIGGAEREVFSLTLGCSYSLDRSRFANQLFLTSQRKRDRIVTLTATVTPNTAELLYASTLPALTPRAFTCRFVNGASYLEIGIGESLWQWQPQPRPRRSESLVDVTGQAFVNDAIPVFTIKLKV